MYQSEATTVIRRYNIILVSSPQSAPFAQSLAMYRDPISGPIPLVLKKPLSKVFTANFYISFMIRLLRTGVKTISEAICFRTDASKHFPDGNNSKR